MNKEVHFQTRSYRLIPAIFNDFEPALHFRRGSGLIHRHDCSRWRAGDRARGAEYLEIRIFAGDRAQAALLCVLVRVLLLTHPIARQTTPQTTPLSGWISL